MVKIAVIGGSGLYSMDGFEKVKTAVIKTPYGNSPEILLGKLNGKDVAFLQRHGKGHTVPPHIINYRANVWALKKLGVERVLATISCGSANPRMRPGELVLLTQFMDFTKCRPQTFYEKGRVVHVDVSEPYCPELRRALAGAAGKLGIKVHQSATYACTEGPRFETVAEVKALQKLGADLVGMTNIPECVLARELEMCYAAVGTITNFAAGISRRKLTYTEVAKTMKRNRGRLQGLIREAILKIPAKRSCKCGEALEGAVVKI